MLNITGGNTLKFPAIKIIYGLLPIIFCLVFVLLVGKDLNYDALNYHAYLPFSLLEDRIGQDFYPAGPQSYLNPAGYVFFYALINIFESSVWVAVFLAVSHSSIIYVLYFISRKLAVELIGERSLKVEFLSLVSVVLGCSTLMLIQEIGNSFIDVYTVSLNLLALYCIISMRTEKDLRLAGMAGAAIGVSVAFKSISVIYAFPLFFVFLVKVGVSARNLRLILSFCIASVVVYTAVAGFWLFRVYQYTGNPIFPLFNDIFCSDFYFCQSISQVRFQKESLADYLSWPLFMAMPVTWYYSELIAPDIRFLALTITTLGLFIKRRNILFNPKSSVGLVVIFYALSFVLWIVLLGNGRYAIDLFVLVGPLLTLTLFRLTNQKVFLYAVILITGFQATAVVIVGQYRWAPVSFIGEWFDFSIPEELKKTPYLYVSIDSQSASFLALKVNSESAFINISGQLTLPFNEPLQSRFDSMRDSHGSGIKILTRAYSGEIKDWIVPWVEKINLSVERVGLNVNDVDSCQLISPINISDVRGNKIDRERYVVCSALYDERITESFRNDVKIYDQVFDELVDICEDWFNPTYAVTERDGTDWIRRYAGTDLRASVDKHGVIWVRFSNRVLPWSVGNVQTWNIDKREKDICAYQFPKIYHEIF